MGLPSGNFTAGRDGRLHVVFSGVWRVNGSDWGSGDWDILLRCFVGSGPTRRIALINLHNCTASIEVDYTADDVVPLGMEYVSHTFGGAGTVQARDLRIACHLLEPEPLLPATLDELLAALAVNLQPMAATVQTPRWLPDANGAEWYVRPLSALATLEVSRTGYTGDLGGAAFDDEFGRQIDPDSIVAESAPRDGSVWTPMTAIMWAGDLDSVTLRDGVPGGIWRATYRCVETPGDGTTYALAFAGVEAINWASMAAGDTLWVCGTYDDRTLTVGASGAAGAYLKIRLDHATDPGRIYAGRVIQGSEWHAAPNGEYYVEDAKAPNNMLFEDGVRLQGLSITSRATCNVVAYDLAADTLTIKSLRPVVTGTPLVITANINAARIIAPLERQVVYYAIFVSGPAWTYTLQMKSYVIKLATSAANASAGIAVDITAAGDGNTWYFLNTTTAYPFADPQPGSLTPGQFGYDPVNARLYYRPSSGGTPAAHAVRWSQDQTAGDGACIYIEGRSHVRILGGGEYGGIFGVAPRGECSYAHLQPVAIRSSSDIVVDGLRMYGCRQAVGWRDTARLTVRNCDVEDAGWHAIGSDQVTQAVGSPDLIVERNRCRKIGLRHDWGDVQGIITTPNHDRAIIRRNLIQECARNEVIINTGTIVLDSSPDLVAYLNWHDDYSGVGIVTAPGPDGPIPRARAVANIFTRGANPARLGAYAEPVHGRIGAFALVNQNTDANPVSDFRAWGNIIAHGHVPYVAYVAPTEHLGHVHLRTKGLVGVEVSDWSRNAFAACTGLIYCITRWDANTPHGTLQGDRNLYAATPGTDPDARWFERWSNTTLDAAVDALHLLDTGPGSWRGETGNDAAGAFVGSVQPGSTYAGPTATQLEILRLHDAYDTATPPTVALVGDFPFA